MIFYNFILKKKYFIYFHLRKVIYTNYLNIYIYIYIYIYNFICKRIFIKQKIFWAIIIKKNVLNLYKKNF